MSEQKQKQLFEEIVLALGDFFKAEACGFIAGNGKIWYDLPAAQIGRLREIYERAGPDLEKRKKDLQTFLNEQRDKERDKRKQPRWQTLFPKEGGDDYLTAFLFSKDEALFATLHDQAVELVALRGKKEATAGALLAGEVETYLSLTKETPASIKNWQDEELLSRLVEKRFYTLLNLHRLNLAASNHKIEKEWLPCSHSTH